MTPCREHPLPRATRDLWSSLDGAWEVQLDPGTAWRPIVVPFAFEAQLSGIGAGGEVHERIRYRRTFTIPRPWAPRTLLHFGAVDWRATVTVDGVDAGSHEGGFTHFCFDLGSLGPGTEHEVVVDVFDPAADAFGQPKGKQRGSHGIWYARATGIWQTVWIEGVPERYLVDVAVTATADGVVRAAAGATVTVRAEGSVVATGMGAARVEQPREWSPGDPFLYDVELALGDDRVASYVGFRSIEARGRELFLNRKPLRIAGVLDQGFWPDGGYTAPNGEALRADVEAARSLGFDLARKHVKVEDPRWYAWCDRLGLLVAQDLPSSHDLSTVEAQERLAGEWAEIVRQHAGHPSILVWVPINEDWGEPPPAFQRDLVRLTREVDPTRLVIDASGWNQLDETDLVDVHDYGTELTQHVGRREDIPLWIGECGGVSLFVEGHARTPDFSYRDVGDGVELARAFRSVVEQIPRDVAGFVWTQLSDVEGELNGLLTSDRVPKLDAAAIRAVNDAFRRGPRPGPAHGGPRGLL